LLITQNYQIYIINLSWIQITCCQVLILCCFTNKKLPHCLQYPHRFKWKLTFFISITRKEHTWESDLPRWSYKIYNLYILTKTNQTCIFLVNVKQSLLFIMWVVLSKFTKGKNLCCSFLTWYTSSAVDKGKDHSTKWPSNSLDTNCGALVGRFCHTHHSQNSDIKKQECGHKFCYPCPIERPWC